MKKLIIILTILLFTSIGWTEESEEPVESLEQETMTALLLANKDSNCINNCAIEKSICISQCSFDNYQCKNRCSQTFGRCVSRCN